MLISSWVSSHSSLAGAGCEARAAPPWPGAGVGARACGTLGGRAGPSGGGVPIGGVDRGLGLDDGPPVEPGAGVGFTACNIEELTRPTPAKG
ncbi:MAG: hypothetical protein ACOC9O_01025, partial [Myxococcota bacterium]